MSEPIWKLSDPEFLKNSSQEELNAVFEEQKAFSKRKRWVERISGFFVFVFVTCILWLIYNCIFVPLFNLPRLDIGKFCLVLVALKFSINIFRAFLDI